MVRTYFSKSYYCYDYQETKIAKRLLGKEEQLKAIRVNYRTNVKLTSRTSKEKKTMFISASNIGEINVF